MLFARIIIVNETLYIFNVTNYLFLCYSIQSIVPLNWICGGGGETEWENCSYYIYKNIYVILKLYLCNTRRICNVCNIYNKYSHSTHSTVFYRCWKKMINCWQICKQHHHTTTVIYIYLKIKSADLLYICMLNNRKRVIEKNKILNKYYIWYARKFVLFKRKWFF